MGQPVLLGGMAQRLSGKVAVVTGLLLLSVIVFVAAAVPANVADMPTFLQVQPKALV